MNRSTEVESFYTSRRWRKCRTSFANAKGNLCEECLARGIIEPGSNEQPLEVHHKIPLTAENIKDPRITLNWENLQLLCKDCHDKKKARKEKRWRCDEFGHVSL